MGSEAKEFLIERRQAKKRPLLRDEVYCLSCKAPRKFFENMVQLDTVPGKTARITGFCATCEGSASRIIGAAQIDQLDRYFEVTSNKDEAA